MLAQIGSLGWPELLIILVIVLLVFGVGRISRVGSELGKGIQAFRTGMKDAKEEATGDEVEVEVEVEVEA